MDPLAIRHATLADTEALVALVASAYRGEESRQGWTTEADLLEGQRIDADTLREDLTRERSVVLVAEQGARLVGCCHVAEVSGAGYFGMFAVDPAGQGGGVGSAIMEAAETFARDVWGLTSMRMTVIDARAELIAYYERRGYVRTGETAPFPYGDERFGIPQRDDLRFAVLSKGLPAPGS